MPKNKLNLVELYAGTARSAAAFKRWRRVRTGLLVDNDQFAFDTHFQNDPGAPYLRASVASLSPQAVESYAGGRVDILVGCPPCQGFSDAVHRPLGDPRNRHLWHFATLAAALRPLAVALENVPLAGATRRFANFVERMESLGYRATWGVLNAALRGSTQCRHRLIYIAFRGDVGVDPTIPAPTHGGQRTYFNYAQRRFMKLATEPMTLLCESPGARRVRGKAPYQEAVRPDKTNNIPTVQETLVGLPDVGSASADALSHLLWAHSPATRRRMAHVPEGGRWTGGRDHFSQAYGRLHRFGLANTLTTFFPNSGSGRFWHPQENRAITIREAARLQGFPDEFLFLPQAVATSRLIGNALDSRLADVTYEVIRRCLG